jgi:hypothetical protein
MGFSRWALAKTCSLTKAPISGDTAALEDTEFVGEKGPFRKLPGRGGSQARFSEAFRALLEESLSGVRSVSAAARGAIRLVAPAWSKLSLALIAFAEVEAHQLSPIKKPRKGAFGTSRAVLGTFRLDGG